jgi:hypothetical protein
MGAGRLGSGWLGDVIVRNANFKDANWEAALSPHNLRCSVDNSIAEKFQVRKGGSPPLRKTLSTDYTDFIDQELRYLYGVTTLFYRKG